MRNSEKLNQRLFQVSGAGHALPFPLTPSGHFVWRRPILLEDSAITTKPSVMSSIDKKIFSAPELIYQAAHKAGKDAEAKITSPDCFGFCWIVITPARGEFVKYLRDNNIGWKYERGGWCVSASPLYARAREYGRAFAVEIAKYGIKSYLHSELN